MADLRISELIQRTPNGQEYFEVIIPPFTPGTNRKVLLSDLAAILGTGSVASVTGDGVGGTATDPVLTFPTPTDIGLGNVDNTSDANKPVSTAQQTALNLKENALVTIRTEVASHTLDATDLTNVNLGVKLMIQMNLTGTANNLTIPPNATQAFPVGTEIVVKQLGTGVTTLVEGAGVTITPPAGGNLIAPGQGQPMVLIKTGTDAWDLYNGNAPSALTRANNANVGITLGGAPATALLSAVSLTVDWLAPTGTAALNFDLTAVDYQDLTITVTGAVDGDIVILGIPNAAAVADVTFCAWVSAADTVTVRASLVGGATTADPASGTFRATIIKH